MCVISNTEYTRKYFAREYYCHTTAVCTARVCSSSIPSNQHVLGHILSLDCPKKIMPTKKEKNIKADDRERMDEYSAWKKKKRPCATNTGYDWCTYQLSSRYYNLLLRIFRAGFVLIIECAWSALRNCGARLGLSVNFLVRYFESVKKHLVQKIQPRDPRCTYYWRAYLVLASTRIRETEERDISHTTAVSCR